ncbi:unnamed protein product [Boreogadus saida]
MIERLGSWNRMLTLKEEEEDKEEAKMSLSLFIKPPALSQPPQPVQLTLPLPSPILLCIFIVVTSSTAIQTFSRRTANPSRPLLRLCAPLHVFFYPGFVFV